MRCTWINFKHRVSDELRRELCRVVDRYNLVVVSMQDKGWDVDFSKVVYESGFAKRLDTEVSCL